jgi:hypothetical protein
MVRWMLGLVMACTLAMAGCSKGVVVQNPAPFAAAASPAATEQAILDALPRHNWSAESVEPGKIVGFLSVRSHLLRVDISYDDSNVVLAYRDSDHLNEERGEGGQVVAHRNVNKWMDTLAQDVRLAIAAQPAPSQDATLSAGGEVTAPPAPATAAPATTNATAPTDAAAAPSPAP